MSVLGNRLRELRGSSSLYDIQKGTGISRTQIMLYERGEQFPSAQSLKKLALFFDIPYEALRSEYYEDLYADPIERDNLLRWAVSKSLSPDESRLIDYYRQLTIEQQIRYIANIELQLNQDKVLDETEGEIDI